jgi:acetyl-CoA carboxylase biotin carboxyl carrier protein
MEYEKIKQLMDDMGNSKLNSIDIEFPDGTKLKMEKKEEKILVETNKVNVVEEKKIENNEEKKENEIEGKIVKSPMIGTFYSKPSPTSDPYVEVGSVVKKGNVLCIIEAMKLMNEIESEYEGKIVEIYVKDGETVDYGKPLFRIV